MSDKEKELRIAAAQKIRDARAADKSYDNDQIAYRRIRGEGEFRREILGLTHLFEYIRTLPSKKILEIGGGEGNARGEFSDNPNLHDLYFEGTDLINTGSANYVTSAEVMRGISSNAYGGVLSMYSISYSEAPELVGRQINRVLIPAGVFKGTFPRSDRLMAVNQLAHMLRVPPRTPGGEVIMQRANGQNYYQFFRALGFDVAGIIEDTENSYPRLAEKNAEDPLTVILAIKPGGTQKVSAKELLMADLRKE